MIRRLPIPAPVLALLALLLVSPSVPSALAHEEGVIRLSAERVPVGSEIEIEGEEMGEEVRLKLRLEGALETHDLEEVVSDEEGTFLITITLPDAVAPGRYRVIATAPDGDEVARADLEIVAAGEAGQARSEPAEATDAPMPVETDPGPGEWIAILAFVLLTGIGGVALLLGGRRPTG